MTVTVAEEPWDSADGVRLRRAMQAELAARYNMPDQETEPPNAETITVFLIARAGGGDATGCGDLRLLDDGRAEIKRMYVTPQARGTGVATRILRALEDHARQTGPTQWSWRPASSSPTRSGSTSVRATNRSTATGRTSGNRWPNASPSNSAEGRSSRRRRRPWSSRAPGNARHRRAKPPTVRGRCAHLDRPTPEAEAPGCSCRAGRPCAR